MKKIWTKLLLEKEEQSASSLQSFKENYEASKDFVRSSIYWLIRNEQIDDIVQDTYLKAWANYSSFDGRSSFNTWIFRIARNTAYDYLRKNKKLQVTENSLESNTAEMPFDQKEMITKALMKLNEKQREVFILFYKFEYTQEEIAKALKLPLGTVKSRIHNAKNNFNHYINELGVKNERQ